MRPTTNTSVAPAIMNFTAATPIEEGVEYKAYYDPASQTYMCMGVIGTKCLKLSYTRLDSKGGNKTDRKNEIDDSKTK